MKKRKLPPLRIDQIDPRCLEDIFRAVRGDRSAWPFDPHYPPRGTYQERFDRGDKQMPLWAIVLAAKKGEEMPRWAAAALEEAMLGMATGSDWADVFGRERAERGNKTGANRNSIRNRAQKMYAVWDFMQKQREQGIGTGPKLYRAAADALDVSPTLAQRYHSRMKRYYKQVALGPKTKAL